MLLIALLAQQNTSIQPKPKDKNMSVTAQDVQNVIDVSGILADNEVAVKPDLVAALLDWKSGGELTPPAPASVKSNVADKVSKPKTVETVSTPDPSADDPGF